jgi:hypothetical protein
LIYASKRLEQYKSTPDQFTFMNSATWVTRSNTFHIHQELLMDKPICAVGAGMLAICLGGVCKFAFPETVAIQNYSVLKHFKIKIV